MVQDRASEASIEFVDERGQNLVRMSIVPRTPGTLFVIPNRVAYERSEEPIQLVEGMSYEYEINNIPVGMRLRESSVVQPSKRHPYIGRIEPGLAVGLLPLVIEDSRGTPTARAMLEVRTAKLDYHNDYRFMLDDLANRALGLLTEVRAPAMSRLVADDNTPASVIHHQFAFLRATLDSQLFRGSIARILSDPHRRWIDRQESVDIRRVGRPTPALIRAIAGGTPRVHLPEAHPLSMSMAARSISSSSVPRTVPQSRPLETVDTAENQFVKFALSEFEGMLATMEQRITKTARTADVRLRREIGRLRDQLTSILSAGLFKDVSNPRLLPLGSPVLQRKSGYREVLETWLRFQLAAKLSWDGGGDVYEAGKRDVALLYEYWIFFQLLEAVSALLQLDVPPSRQLIDWTQDRFDLRLKSGTMLSFDGLVRGTDRPMRARFSYNRTFPGSIAESPNFPRAGSWTRTMRPDFTVSLWPAEYAAAEAELNERIVHIHFDAKYRVDRITDLFGSEDPSAIDADDLADRENTRAKRADLLKMHAYRDAIRRTEGAYVIYPGVSGSQVWRGFHEILPGLGAFALRPDSSDSGAPAIVDFLTDVVLHIANPDTDRERARQAVANVYLPGSSSKPPTPI